MKRFLLRVLPLWTLLSLPSQAAPPVIPEAVKKSVRDRVDFEYVPGMVVAMVNADGRTVFSYGSISRENLTTPDETTLYEIASVTKTLTTTLLAQMVTAGDLSLSDKAGHFLPDGVNMPGNGGENITLEQLANHTSGLPNTPGNLLSTITDYANQFSNYQLDDFHEFLGSFTLPRTPGSAYEYSNTGIALLGYVLALSQDTDYETLLKQRVLSPLDMFDTGITLNEEQQSRRAPGYHGVIERPQFSMASFAPAGALQSCAIDLCNYLSFQLGLMTGPISPALSRTHLETFSPPDLNYNMGLGWRLMSDSDIIQHGGASYGSTSFVGFRKSTQTAAIVLSNNRGHAPLDVADLGFRCLEPTQSLTTIRSPVTVPVNSLRNWVGTYQHTGGIKMEIGLIDDRLFLNIVGQTAYTLFPINAVGRFGLPEAEFTAEVTFQNDAFSFAQNGGVPISLARIRKKGDLSLSHSDGQLTLHLDGEGDQNYPLESSTDLKEWQSMGTISIWETKQETLSEAPKYFRIQQP